MGKRWEIAKGACGYRGRLIKRVKVGRIGKGCLEEQKGLIKSVKRVGLGKGACGS